MAAVHRESGRLAARQAASEPGVVPGPGRHRFVVGVYLESRAQSGVVEVEVLDDVPTPGPAAVEIAAQRGVMRGEVQHLPGAVERDAVDGVGWHVDGQLVSSSVPVDAAASDASGIGRHGVVAPIEQSVPASAQQFEVADAK